MCLRSDCENVDSDWSSQYSLWHAFIQQNLEETTHVCSADKSYVMFYLVGGAGSARDEWLTRVAVLGRAAPLLALPLLSNLIVHRQQQVAHSMTAGGLRHQATSLYHCGDHAPLFTIALITATAPDSNITLQC